MTTIFHIALFFYLLICFTLAGDLSAYKWEFKGEQYTVSPTPELNEKYERLLILGYNPALFDDFISSLYNKPARRQGNWEYENINYYAKEYDGEELKMIFLNLYREYLINHQLNEDRDRYKLYKITKKDVVLVGEIESTVTHKKNLSTREMLYGRIKNIGINTVGMVKISFDFDMSDGKKKHLETYSTSMSKNQMDGYEDEVFKLLDASFSDFKLFIDQSLIEPNRIGYFQLFIPSDFGLYDSYEYKIEYIDL